MAPKKMIAPCGVDCSRCTHYLANTNPTARQQGAHWSAVLDVPIETITCNGCRAQAGRIPLQKHLFGDRHGCTIYGCAQGRGVDYCGLCDHFPCNKRHPYTENQELLPQKAKAVLCL